MSNNFVPSSEDMVMWRVRIPLKRSAFERLEAEAKETKRLLAAMAAYILEEHYREAAKDGK